MKYDSSAQKVPALSRTWETVTDDCMDGAVVQTRRHTVTISKLSGHFTAEIDGQPAGVMDVDAILRGATTKTVIHEIISVPSSMARCLGVRA